MNDRPFAHLWAERAATLHDASLKEVLDTHPGVISFAGGLPDERAFDYDRIAAVTERAAPDPRAWQYCPTEGFVELRAAVAEEMHRLGVAADIDNILITQGSQQGLDLINKAFVNPGENVMVEAPGYIGGIKAVESYQGRILPVPLEEDGIKVEALERIEEPAKFLYTVSTFQNPTGCTLAHPKRVRLLELAEERGFLILEDGAYVHLRFEGEEAVPIKALDDGGRVIYLGSFSKVLVPGIRVGWIVAHPEIIQRLVLIKQATDLAGGSFGQLFALEWLREFGLCPPIDRYKAKRDQALASLHAKMPKGVRWNRAEGGFFLWVTLPPSIDTKALLTSARAAGVAFVPGYAFAGAPNTFRFSFSQVPLGDIEEGVARLAGVIAPPARSEHAGAALTPKEEIPT